MIGPPGVAAMFVAEPLSSLSAPSQIHWLWEPYVARGKVALLDGDPGVGKSLLTLDLAARLSRGLAPPTGAASGRPHVTLILSAEDDIAAMRPRAEAAGADLNWIITVTGPGGAPLVLPDQLADLEAFVCSTEADLVVIDPVMAFLAPGAAANVDQCVRRALNPLAVMAARHGCAILLVRHLCKSDSGKAVLRGQGSIGFVAAARTAMLAARHPADPSLHVLAVSKSNATVRPPSLGYRVKSDAAGRAVVEWAGPVEVSADGLCQPAAAPLRPRDRATLWLSAELAGGPRRVTELLAAAAAAGIPERTLDRAKDQVGARSRRVAGEEGQGWFWYDPAAPWPADAPFGEPLELRPLGS